MKGANENLPFFLLPDLARVWEGVTPDIICFHVRDLKPFYRKYRFRRVKAYFERDVNFLWRFRQDWPKSWRYLIKTPKVGGVTSMISI